MRQLLKELGCDNAPSSSLFMDNQIAVPVSKNPEHFGRTEHRDLLSFRLRDEVERGTFAPNFVPTEDDPADLLTKPLTKPNAEHFRSEMGLVLDD